MGAEYRILGTFEVAADGRVADLGPPKQRALLAILLLHANEIVPVDRLIDLLWGDRPPRRASHALEVYVSALRKALEPLAGADVIAWRPPGYVLAVDPDSVDARRVERLLAEGTRLFEAGDAVGAKATLDRARELWRGPPLSDFVYEEFAQPDIRRLTELWLHGTETLAAVELALGHDREVLQLADAAIREDPLRERPRELQMLSLYRAGRHAEALRAYQSFTGLLAEELGVEPTPILRRLQERILLHDPSLLPERPPDSVATTAPARNPYKGLRAFGEEDAEDFFGREELVGRLLEALAGGARLLALVGPSGCGKSSAVNAGLIPALRAGTVPGSERWFIARMLPGARLFEAREAALRRAAGAWGPDPRELLAEADGGLVEAARRILPAGAELVLVVDQFEEVFTSAEEAEGVRFLRSLTRTAADATGRIRVVLTLRADFYDRPLLQAAFASVFLPGVVNVVPMAAAELETAVVEPARRVGVEIDPALLAELVSETVDRPGALPFLQHMLAELFDRRADGKLSLDAYRSLGGLHGALSRRAEEVFTGFDEERGLAARQVLLRLVRLGEGARDAGRRVPLRELTGLEIDPVALSDVLAAFDRNRLVSLDRDPVTGDATVEVAHEALLSGWERLAAWIDHGRTDLRLHGALAARVEEWAATGRASDDLLTGSRLEEYEAWARETTLRLTATEQAFVDASLERRRAEQADREARAARERRLERRARVRLVGFVGAVALFIAAAGYGLLAWPGPAPDVVLVYPGPGDAGMYDSIGAGFDDAVTRLGLDAQVVIERPEGLRERLLRLSEQGVRLIVVAFERSNPDVEIVARDHPGTSFIASDYWGELLNVTKPRLAVEEGAFLVGVAAALNSSTGTVGVIGEFDAAGQWWFVGGFEAGAREADPDVEVLISYLPEGPITFVTVNRAARDMYRAGADVIFYSGRSAPLGLFEAAWSESDAQGRQLWAIGVDTNWYVALPFVGPREGREAGAWRSNVLTSMITRYDLAISTMIDGFARGALAPGERRFGLADGAFELATSGGFLADARPVIDSLRNRVVAGEIVVPRYPADRGPPR
ncbi:MAG: hypothetical protein A2X23_08935 [Chloroflexi bacterium GWC2_73_18]|nr:MAG: hypothetical protein A2X23_08935 [Chloroflexi bacterium GWC2_73_18]